MSQFINFKQAVNTQIQRMSKGLLLEVAVDKYELWDLYLSSFPEGTNPIFRERTEHDCNCCKQFIRNIGAVVSYDANGNLQSIWDVQGDVPSHFLTVANALGEYIRSLPMKGIYLNDQVNVGTNRNQDTENPDITWDHFFTKVPESIVKHKDLIASLKGQAANNYNVLKRSIEEITTESIETVLELIRNKSLYRGEEHKSRVIQLAKVQSQYNNSKRPEGFLWATSGTLGVASGFRNSVIGTLLVDLSEGKDLEYAVKAFETKVAPANYKRSSSLITQGMITKAQDTIVSLGLGASLSRRYAVSTDLSINDVLFADRSIQKDMGVLDMLSPTSFSNRPDSGNMEDISIQDFMSNVLPRVDTIELLMDNSHTGNLMSIVAPETSGSSNILKWGNNFSWSYNGEITDSMKENVKAKGGNVDGVLRFSIQWNTEGRANMNDLDAHCFGPSSEHIYYSNQTGNRYSGTLDVDIMTPQGVAVENIIYTNSHKMPDGDYDFQVKNYSGRIANNGFTAEIEFAGQILSFDYGESMRGGEFVKVGTIRKQGNKLELVKSMPHSASTKEIWGLHTLQYTKVKTIMHSPNHWESGNDKGNKHFFFILENCVNPEGTRGLYNEFLREDLHDHRKVFEVLGSKLRVPESEEQLSGLGFSSTLSNQVTAKVRGEINRTYNIKFN